MAAISAGFGFFGVLLLENAEVGFDAIVGYGLAAE